MSFKEEVEEEKNKDVPVLDDDNQEEHREEDHDDSEGSEEERHDDEETSEKEPDKESSDEEEEKERLRKQEEYRERKRKEKEEAEKRQESYQQSTNSAINNIQTSVHDDEIEELKQLAREQKFERAMSQAEQELIDLEKPFKEAFDDYDDIVDKALRFTEKAYIRKGMTESQAKYVLRREKILLADAAAAQGKDPVEAVYNEAKNIVSVIDEMAQELGYTKGKSKTNLQAAKELAKPNAMSGGAGGAKAAQKTYDELDDDDMEDIANITLSQLGMK